MKLYYHKDPLGNVGDDLNPWLWSRLLPDIFSGEMWHDPHKRSPDEYLGPLFVGIGTLLNEHIPNINLKAIMGTGTGYGGAPTLERSKIYALRGPLTTRRLGVSEKYAITDSAVLVKRLIDIKSNKLHSVSFIPHCSTAREKAWDQICEDLGIFMIDPSLDPDTFFVQLLSSEMVITEAMHGAILADALRIPWIAVKTHAGVLDFKWQDWCQSIELDYAPIFLPSLWSIPPDAFPWKKFKQKIKKKIAYRQLKNVMQNARPLLSDAAILESKIQQLEGAIERFIKDFQNGKYSAF